MKILNICLVACAALAMTACGSKDPKEVKTIYDNHNNIEDLTDDQVAKALDWYVEYQEESIEHLQDIIDDFENIGLNQMASVVAINVYNQIERTDSEIADKKEFKDVLKKIEKNQEEIDRLTEKLEDLEKDFDEKYKE